MPLQRHAATARRRRNRQPEPPADGPMPACLADTGANYQVRVRGQLHPTSVARLGGLRLAVHDRGQAAVTDLTGFVTDQAALMGLLEHLYALGVTLLKVERLREAETSADHA